MSEDKTSPEYLKRHLGIKAGEVYEPEVDKTLACIAKDELGVTHWEIRHWDRHDFHDVGIGSIRRALRAAYRAGQESQLQETK